MLGKLLRYELPAMGRKLVPLYAAWGVTAVLLGVTAQMASSKSEFMVVITGLMYTAVATAVMVMSVILIVQRYRDSLLGDEAYFNHVLPVSVTEHIGNKLLSATIWVIATVFAALLTGIIIMIAAMIVSGFDFTVFNLDPGELYIPEHFGLYVLEVLILIIASIVKSVMQIYAAITIGHQAAKHTTLASIGAYILILIFEGTIGRILVPLIFRTNTHVNEFAAVAHVFVPALLLTIFFSAVYFFVCKYLMENRLNLA
ncbi:MAG: hypothetical protein IJ227_04720 [Mogibacterium sp.]|nr:hypothetical protein [Mogibacterium sp.]